MKIRHVLTGVAAAAVLVVGGSAAPAAVAASPDHVTLHNLPDATPTADTAPAEAGAGGAASMSKATIWDKNFVDLLYKYCLDDSSGAHLRMNTCSDASYDNGYQRWTVTQDGDEYKFKNADTHLCLDGSAGAGVRTYACSDASYNNGYQMWKRVYSVTSNGTTWVAWGNVATGKCMDYSLGDHLKLKPCSSASFNNGYQAWNY